MTQIISARHILDESVVELTAMHTVTFVTPQSGEINVSISIDGEIRVATRNHTLNIEPKAGNVVAVSDKRPATPEAGDLWLEP